MDTNFDHKPSTWSRNAWVALITVLVLLTWLPLINDMADQGIDDGFNRALVSFGIAKGMNMVISLIQSAQFSAKTIVFGMTIAPGELLDPINDLVEQFSTVMLFATVSFGIQKILVAIGGHVLVKSLVSALGITAAWLILKRRSLPNWLINALILALMVRLAVPAATILSNAAFETFLAPQYQASTEGLRESTVQLEELKSSTQSPAQPTALTESSPPEAAQTDNAEATQPVAAPKPSWWARTKTIVSSVAPPKPSALINNTLGKINAWSQRIEEIGKQTTNYIVSQIIVFMLQTVIFPIGLIWVLYKIGISLFQRPRP